MKDLKILFTIIILTIIGYFAFSTQRTVAPQDDSQFGSTSILSLDEARSLVIEKWGDCRAIDCADLNVITYSRGDISYVVAIYSGLKDDSVSAIRKIAPMKYVDGNWFFGEIDQTIKCYEGRGHEDFSVEKCL